MKNSIMDHQNSADNKSTEIVKKFNFTSKDTKESYEIDIIELLGGVYR